MTDYRRVIQLNSIITTLGFLDTHMLIPVMALYAISLGADILMVGIIIGAYSASNIISNIGGGICVDKFGYKPPLVLGLMGDAMAMFAYALAQTPWHLILIRLFHGISGGLIGPATMCISATYCSPERRAKMMSYYGISIAVASLIGYGSGGAIASNLGYHFLFKLGGFMLIGGASLAMLLPSHKSGKSAPTRSDINIDNKLKELIKYKKTAVSYSSIFANYFAYGGLVALLPLHLTEFGMEVFHMGMLLAIFSLMFMIMQVFGGSLSDKTGRLKPIASSIAFCMICLYLISISDSFLPLAVAMSIYGFAYGVLFPSISSLLADSVPSNLYGSAAGIFHALITLGVAIGAPLMSIAASLTSVQSGLSLLSLIFLPSLVICLIALKQKV